ncbi:hypothetical protein JHK87_021331 [Glycine soja]|nr:hypothetical protein JHK87_021331 [Glycine soja]
MSILASITLKQVGSQYSCSECSVAYSNRTHKESQQERNKNINNEKLQRNPNHLDEINPLLALLLKTNSPRNVEIKRQALSAISALGYEFWDQTLCLGLWFHRSHLQLFNVAEYGAIADGKEDNSVAFLKAWSDACKWNGSATVLIPKGTYMLKSVIFKGPCNDSITFQIKGVLKAPIDPSLLTDQKWINF